ncbi:MAG TPA: RteC domain-containing protein, partial [Puia sp.]|nr:RteC domain-containing protein [Puia sp.]
MLDFAKQLFEALYQDLAALDNINESLGLAPKNLAPMIQAAIDNLSERLRTHVFESEAEEAEFFKTGLPPLLALASYYVTKYKLELTLQYGNSSSVKRRIHLLIDEMSSFFQEHAGFVDYCLAGRTDKDRYYFLRNSPANEKTIDMLTILVDPEISTVHSVRTAMIISYVWLMRDMDEAKFDSLYRERQPRARNTLQWTD